MSFGLFTMQEPSYLGKMALLSIWFRMVLIPTNNLGAQKNFQLDIPMKCQYLSGITILIPMDRFFDTTIDVDLLIPCFQLYTRPTLVWTFKMSNIFMKCTNHLTLSPHREPCGASFKNMIHCEATSCLYQGGPFGIKILRCSKNK